MKKFFALGLAAALSLTLLAGCGGENNNGGGHENNTDPVIDGVKVSATVMAGEEFDALAGVTAHDEEDGDLTDKIVVSSTDLTFTDGKTTPTEPSEYIGYEIIYSVTDSDGATATEYCTLYVKQAASELETVFAADFSDMTPGETDNHWWDFVNDGAEATATLKQGAYVADVTDLKGVGDDKLMFTRMFNDLGAGEYEFVIWANSSVATKINMNALLEGEENWDAKNLGGGKYNVEVGESIQTISHKFTLGQDNASVLFRICLGGGDRPNAFSFALEKVAIYKTTGVDVESDVFKKDSFEDSAGLAITNQGDGAVATAEHDATENAAKINISTYNTAGGIWSVSAMLPFTGLEIKNDTRYGYEIVVKATNATSSEVIIAPADNKEAGGREIQYGVAIGTTDTTIRGSFTAGFASETPALHLQLGKDPAAEMTSNVILIKSVRIYTIVGDKKTDRVAQDKFVLFGNGSSNATNAKYPIDVFNASDDNPANKGIGTAYIEGGKLIYKIHEAGSDGGNNKLAFGYWDNPINLPANAYYVVSFKIKASAAISFNLTLHDMNRAWGSADEGVLLRRASWLNNSAIQIGTTEQTFEFVTDDPVFDACKCELLLEFGSAAITGEVTIEISELTIGVRKLAD